MKIYKRKSHPHTSLRGGTTKQSPTTKRFLNNDPDFFRPGFFLPSVVGIHLLANSIEYAKREHAKSVFLQKHLCTGFGKAVKLR